MYGVWIRHTRRTNLKKSSSEEYHKMSFQCPKCPKSFQTERHLQDHITKKLPCDLRCRICQDFQGKDRFHYYRHQKAKHPRVPKEKDEEEVLTLEPVQQQQSIDFIPIEDFNWKYLESIADTVEITERFYDKVEHSKDQNGKEEVERVQGYERRTKLTLRAENARRSLPNAILSNILECLYHRCDLAEMMYALLHDVHAQRVEPRLLVIRGNDINRKSVSIYSRPPPTDECFWITNSNSVALKKTRDHCESLFNFALVSAIGSLQAAIEYRPGSQVLWLVCPTKSSGKHKAFTLTKNREDADALWCAELDLDANNVVTLPINDKQNQQYVGFRDKIVSEIEKNKEQILERLKHVELDDKRLNDFFELAKDASMGIVPSPNH